MTRRSIKGLHIEILGTRGMIAARAPRHRCHSGVLVDGLLFDLGEHAFLLRNPRAIFLTHLHPDHAFFVDAPFPLPPVPTYAPERNSYPFLQIAKPLRMRDVRITPIPTEHSLKVKSCAYLIEKGKKRLLYTGDLYWMKRRYRKRLGRLDCVITEGSFLQEGGAVRRDARGRWGHTGIPNLVRLFKPHTDLIVLTHFGSWFFRDVRASRAALFALGRQYGVQLMAAYDGMALTL